jgi:hypothetical protein
MIWQARRRESGMSPRRSGSRLSPKLVSERLREDGDRVSGPLGKQGRIGSTQIVKGPEDRVISQMTG